MPIKVIMTAEDMRRSLARMAHEIVERNHSLENLILVGMRTRGVPLAKKLADNIAAFEGLRVPVGALDFSLYRDDLSTVGPKPVIQKSDIGCPVDDRNVVLVDDVLYTGRTTRAALDALVDHGRPRRVQLLALIDRGHRELPIEAGFVGRTMQTTRNEIIEVKLQETDGMEKVLLVEKET